MLRLILRGCGHKSRLKGCHVNVNVGKWRDTRPRGKKKTLLIRAKYFFPSSLFTGEKVRLGYLYAAPVGGPVGSCLAGSPWPMELIQRKKINTHKLDESRLFCQEKRSSLGLHFIRWSVTAVSSEWDYNGEIDLKVHSLDKEFYQKAD